MGRFHAYLISAAGILDQYEGKEPFAAFLKRHFSRKKKFGSKDRKEISHLCYCYFRLGPRPHFPRKKRHSEEERILRGLFLCSNQPHDILNEIRPEWNKKVMLSVKEKLSFLAEGQGGIIYRLSSLPAGEAGVFPWKEELSAGIDYDGFCESFFIQPDLFMRIRPGFAQMVLLKLDVLDVKYEFISPFTIRLHNSFNADKYFEIDKEIVIQDYNSQRIWEFLPVRPGRSDRVWDCCAGSGGKSLMAYDLNPGIVLSVSDVRESILSNLKNRFKKAGIKNYKGFVADLSGNKSKINLKSELIICDIPCTGSGTWSRTPEQLYFFDENKIEKYSALQKKIVSNVIPHIKPGGHLVYITCSVFRSENEDVVEFIKQKFQLQLKQMELLKGYDIKADSMFVAVFTA